MNLISVYLRYRGDDGFIHVLREGEKEVLSGRGVRVARVWVACCGERVFTEQRPPPLVDEPATCLECIGDVTE